MNQLQPIPLPLGDAPVPTLDAVFYQDVREFMVWMACNYYLAPHRKQVEKDSGLTQQDILRAAWGKDLDRHKADRIRKWLKDNPNYRND